MGNERDKDEYLTGALVRSLHSSPLNRISIVLLVVTERDAFSSLTEANHLCNFHKIQTFFTLIFVYALPLFDIFASCRFLLRNRHLGDDITIVRLTSVYFEAPMHAMLLIDRLSIFYLPSLIQIS